MRLTAIYDASRDMTNGGVGVVFSSTRDRFAGAPVSAYKTCQDRNCLVANLNAGIAGQDVDEIGHNVSDAKSRGSAPLTGETVEGDLAYRRHRITQSTAKGIPRSIAGIMIQEEKARSPYL